MSSYTARDMRLCKCSIVFIIPCVRTTIGTIHSPWHLPYYAMKFYESHYLFNSDILILLLNLNQHLKLLFLLVLYLIYMLCNKCVLNEMVYAVDKALMM